MSSGSATIRQAMQDKQCRTRWGLSPFISEPDRGIFRQKPDMYHMTNTGVGSGTVCRQPLSAPRTSANPPIRDWDQHGTCPVQTVLNGILGEIISECTLCTSTLELCNHGLWLMLSWLNFINLYSSPLDIYRTPQPCSHAFRLFIPHTISTTLHEPQLTI